jgi:hypothetical protein
MALKTYAVLDENELVIDIIEFDVLSGAPIPYQNVSLVKVIDSVPTIGQKWNGDLNQFI